MATLEISDSDESPVSPQRMVRDWLREAIVGRFDEISNEQLVQLGLERFRFDGEFAHALSLHAIPEMVLNEMRTVLGRSRGGYIATQSGGVSSERFEEMVTSRASLWYEEVARGQRKSLLMMVKPDLLFAVERRELRISTETKRVEFLRDLAGGLKNRKQTVGERYDESALRSVWDRHFS